VAPGTDAQSAGVLQLMSQILSVPQLSAEATQLAPAKRPQLAAAEQVNVQTWQTQDKSPPQAASLSQVDKK